MGKVKKIALSLAIFLTSLFVAYYFTNQAFQAGSQNFSIQNCETRFPIATGCQGMYNPSFLVFLPGIFAIGLGLIIIYIYLRRGKK